MARPTDSDLHESLQDIIQEVRRARLADALHLLTQLQAALAPHLHNFGSAGISGIQNPIVTVALYLNVARRDLEAHNAAIAIVALESAVQILKPQPLAHSLEPALQRPDDIQAGINEIIRLAKAGYVDVARAVIENVQTVLAPVEDYGHSGVRARDVTVSMYLNVAGRDLEAGDANAALISLDLALTTWTRWPVQGKAAEE